MKIITRKEAKAQGGLTKPPHRLSQARSCRWSARSLLSIRRSWRRPKRCWSRRLFILCLTMSDHILQQLLDEQRTTNHLLAALLEAPEGEDGEDGEPAPRAYLDGGLR